MRRWASTLADIYRSAAPEWSTVAPVIEQTEICEYGALLLLDSLVKSQGRNPSVLRQVVERLERRYFSTGMSTIDVLLQDDILTELDKRFPHIDTRSDFLVAVDQLPLKHKVRVILSAEKRERRAKAEPAVSSDWRRMEPVDMEEWEKAQFLKGDEKVKRTAFVEATPSSYPGQKLRSLFALQLLECIPSMSFEDLMLYTMSWSGKNRIMRGDLQIDAQEALIRRLLEINRMDLRPYVLSLMAAANSLTSPSAAKLWKDKLIPALMQVHGRNWDITAQRNVELIDSAFTRSGAKTLSLYGAQILYSLRNQPMTQELIELCEDYIPDCQGWTLNHAVLTCRALQNVRRTRIHERVGAAVPTFSGVASQWALLADSLECARESIWDVCPLDLATETEETMLLLLRSMQNVPEAKDSFKFVDLCDAFRRRNRDIPIQ